MQEKLVFRTELAATVKKKKRRRKERAPFFVLLECFLSYTSNFVLFNTQMSRNAYFNGESFIASSQKVSLFTEFEGGFNFRTLQPSGLLFYYSEGVSIYFF